MNRTLLLVLTLLMTTQTNNLHAANNQITLNDMTASALALNEKANNMETALDMMAGIAGVGAGIVSSELLPPKVTNCLLLATIAAQGLRFFIPNRSTLVSADLSSYENENGNTDNIIYKENVRISNRTAPRFCNAAAGLGLAMLVHRIIKS